MLDFNSLATDKMQLLGLRQLKRKQVIKAVFDFTKRHCNKNEFQANAWKVWEQSPSNNLNLEPNNVAATHIQGVRNSEKRRVQPRRKGCTHAVDIWQLKSQPRPKGRNLDEKHLRLAPQGARCLSYIIAKTSTSASMSTSTWNTSDWLSNFSDEVGLYFVSPIYEYDAER